MSVSYPCTEGMLMLVGVKNKLCFLTVSPMYFRFFFFFWTSNTMEKDTSQGGHKAVKMQTHLQMQHVMWKRKLNICGF